ncbi:MAG: phosphoglucosamine mutase [Acidobacteriota bacterium]
MSSPVSLFGTDGIRGPFGQPPLDRDTLTALGRELGRALVRGASEEAGGPPEVLLAGDTRASTPEICSWLAAGLTAAGAKVRYGAVLPTAAVAALTAEGPYAAGIAVSASHNPAADNGVKLITAEGFKWPQEGERELERAIAEDGNASAQETLSAPPLSQDEELLPHYRQLLEGSLEQELGSASPQPLRGLSLVLDCAQGAASELAGSLFRDLGAEVEVLFASPDGHNINEACGSTHPETLQQQVKARGADLGFAFDGDADRALLVDETGELRDGDAMLYLWATALRRGGGLEPSKIVATTMSNLGLVRALAQEGIELVRCEVGDRAVVRTLRQQGLRLGGEQSGHLVDLARSTTGDGLLTAMVLAVLVAAQEGSVSQQLSGFRRYPQTLINVEVGRKPPLEEIPAVAEARQQVEESLGDDGRLVLRYSGTEPLARVMIEGPDEATIGSLAQRLAGVIQDSLGPGR